MEENILHIITTGLGAMSGAYCAYLLAERRLRRNEKEKFLTTILIVLEHLYSIEDYLKNYERIETKGVPVAFYTEPFYMPDIKSEYIFDLMELCFDKDISRCLIAIVGFCRKLEDGVNNYNHFCIPVSALEPIQKQLHFDILSLRTMYEQERGCNSKFPSLDEEIINALKN